MRKAFGLTLAVIAVLGLGACAQPDSAEPTGTVDRAAFDSLLADLAALRPDLDLPLTFPG